MQNELAIDVGWTRTWSYWGLRVIMFLVMENGR